MSDPVDQVIFLATGHKPVNSTAMEQLQADRYRFKVRDEVTQFHLSRQIGCDRFACNEALAMSREKHLAYAETCGFSARLQRQFARQKIHRAHRKIRCNASQSCIIRSQ